MSLLKRLEAGQVTEAESTALWTDDREQFLQLATRMSLDDVFFHVYFGGEWLSDPKLIEAVNKANFGRIIDDWFCVRMGAHHFSLHDQLVHGYGPLAEEKQSVPTEWHEPGLERRWRIQIMALRHVTRLLLFLLQPNMYAIDPSFIDTLCDLESTRTGDARVRPFCVRVWRQLSHQTRLDVMVNAQDDRRDKFICHLIQEEIQTRVAWIQSDMHRFVARTQGNDVANLIRSMLFSTESVSRRTKRALEEGETSDAKRQKH